MQKKAKCANLNYFKSESDLTIPFQRQVRVEKLSTIFFSKGEKALRHFLKCTNSNQKQK